jgi:glucose-1-phosphate adenylyltransferase
MGIYIFDAKYLYRLLEEDLANPDSAHDFGQNIIPKAVAEGCAQAHPFSMSCVPSGTDSRDYWRDVGTIDSYWAANLDLAATIPQLDIYDSEWPIWTHQFQMPPAKFVPGLDGRHGVAANAMVSSGCVISGSHIGESVLFSNVRVESFSRVEHSVIMPGCVIGQGSRIKRAVIDCGCDLPPETVIGENVEADVLRFERTDAGIVLVTQDMLKRLG